MVTRTEGTSQLVVSGPMERYSHVLRIHAVNMNDANELNWWAGKWDHRHRRRGQVRLDVVVDDFGEKIMLCCAPSSSQGTHVLPA
jgi:hypothetical protein